MPYKVTHKTYLKVVNINCLFNTLNHGKAPHVAFYHAHKTFKLLPHLSLIVCVSFNDITWFHT